MKPVYERANIIVTEFDAEDVITTSEVAPLSPTDVLTENAYGSFSSFYKTPGSWF